MATEVRKLDERTKRRIKSLCMDVIYAKPKGSLISRKELFAHVINNVQNIKSYNTDVHWTISGAVNNAVYNNIMTKLDGKRGYFVKL